MASGAGPSIKKNYIYNTLYQCLALITPLITAPYISRVFGADGVGIQSFTNSILTYFTLFAALGTASYGQREIARCRDNRKEVSRVFWEIELVSVFSTSVALIGWIVIILTSDFYRPYYIAWTMSIIAVLFDISWLYAGFEQFKNIVFRNSAVKITGIILLFTVVKSKNDVVLYIAILSTSGLLGNISMWMLLNKYVDRPCFRELRFWKHLKETLVYFVPTIATSIYTVLDKTMIGLITGDSYENGYYEQATKIISIAKTLIFSLNTVMGARMAYLFGRKEYHKIRDGIETSLDFILLMGTAMSFGIAGISPVFVKLFFGEGYDSVTGILNVLCPIIVVIGISNCLGALYFTPSGRRRDSNKVICLGAAVNLCLNCVLIPKYSATGAAVASVLAEIVITLLYIILGKEYVNFTMLFRFMWRRVIAGCCMFAVVRALAGNLPADGLLSLIFQVAGGGITYIVILFVLKDEFLIRNVRNLIDKKKRIEK
ncbi:MAG: flippase [Lachnospiraceae bacterium]